MRTLSILLAASALAACDKTEAAHAPAPTKPVDTAASTTQPPVPTPPPAPKRVPADKAEAFVQAWLADVAKDVPSAATALDGADTNIDQEPCGATPACRKRALDLIRSVKITEEHDVSFGAIEHDRRQYHLPTSDQRWITALPDATWVEWNVDLNTPGMAYGVNVAVEPAATGEPRIVAVSAWSTEITPIDH
ncbi:MAG TPA: hypothetical protein VM261_17480 [Kofleriaceae bacterium]|nr:hypothetical protein [Kofleriaceae bacterium]